MSKTIAIVQARMSSSRLPGKVLKELSGKPVIWHVFNQLSFSQKIDQIVLATSDNEEDDQLENWAKENSINFFRGDLDNVLKRFYDTALNYEGDVIVRITADCPLIDPSIVDEVVQKFLNGNYDYLSNTNPPTFPDGLDAEVFTFIALKEAYENAKLKSELEHVTPYIRNHPEKFKLGSFVGSKNYENLRWTLDNPEDYRLLSEIFDNLFKANSYISYKTVLAFLAVNEELIEINSKIKRNEGLDKSLKEDKELNN